MRLPKSDHQYAPCDRRKLLYIHEEQIGSLVSNAIRQQVVYDWIYLGANLAIEDY